MPDKYRVITFVRIYFFPLMPKAMMHIVMLRTIFRMNSSNVVILKNKSNVLKLPMNEASSSFNGFAFLFRMTDVVSNKRKSKARFRNRIPSTYIFIFITTCIL